MIKIFDRILLYIVALVVLCTFTISKIRPAHSEVAFVDIGKLLDNYKFKKDIENQSNASLYQIKNRIDSFKMLQKLGNASPNIDTMIHRAQYAFNQYYMQSSKEISKKVWERLNPTIEEFGKDRGMQLLIGANGAGTVLYGDKQKDVTDELIQYVNTKYEKGS